MLSWTIFHFVLSVTIGTAYIIFATPGEGSPYNGRRGKAPPKEVPFSDSKYQ